MTEISDFAKLLGCDTVALHIGFVPADRQGADYKDLLNCMRDLLDHLAGNGQHLNLETGQESAEHSALNSFDDAAIATTCSSTSTRPI